MALTREALTTRRIAGSAHLDALILEVDELAARVASMPPSAEQIEHTRRSSILATLALDGARPDDTGGWLDLVRTDTPGEHDDDVRPASHPGDDTQATDEKVQALEFAGAGAAFDADDLAEPLTTAPRDALEELHRRLVDGLVAPDRAARPRTVEQVVHDASTGRVVYFTVDPSRISDELDGLATWLCAHDELAPVVRAGIVHAELLRIHPFDAANGRLARAAARLLLRTASLDPHRLTAFEIPLAEAPLDYHEHIAGALRRREPTVWLEYWVESVAAALRAACPPATSGSALDERLRRLVADHAGGVVTVADVAAATGGTPDRAVRALLDHGLASRVRGSRGLRLQITAPG